LANAELCFPRAREKRFRNYWEEPGFQEVPKQFHPSNEAALGFQDLDTFPLEHLKLIHSLTSPILTATLTATRVTNYLNSNELS
jgi:hypothetical protein